MNVKFSLKMKAKHGPSQVARAGSNDSEGANKVYRGGFTPAGTLLKLRKEKYKK